VLLDDLEEYTNSSERSRIRSATVESVEPMRDQWLRAGGQLCILRSENDGALLVYSSRSKGLSNHRQQLLSAHSIVAFSERSFFLDCIQWWRYNLLMFVVY